ncbi:MAG: glycine zipper 2TM domain-containing protein, partial [Novosphingobium sp.]
RDDRVWYRNGQYYCERDNGTTGLLIGGAVGALLGHQLAGGNDKTIGALVGAAGGAAIGKAIDDGDVKCR